MSGQGRPSRSAPTRLLAQQRARSKQDRGGACCGVKIGGRRAFEGVPLAAPLARTRRVTPLPRLAAHAWPLFQEGQNRGAKTGGKSWGPSVMESTQGSDPILVTRTVSDHRLELVVASDIDDVGVAELGRGGEQAGLRVCAARG
eukprot:366155-Chlamydomonas_euryale.AAC.4